MAIEEVGVRLLAENAAKFERDTKTARAALLGFVDTTVKGSKEIDSSSVKSERAIVSFVDGAERAYGRLDAISEIAIGALRRVGEMAVNALVEAGRATTDFLKDSVSVAGNFEATLNRFASVTGDSLTSAGMDVEDFSDLFLQMGADTQFSAAQAAEAAVALAKGGLDPATIAAGGLAGALALAAAGELDLATAAEITAKQLGVWSSEGVTAADVANLMAQAANASTVDVDELALGLANAGGVAKLTGLTFEETNQTMALLAPGFSSAADAGTSFKTFLSSLIPTTDKAKNAMKDLGLATSDGSSLFFDAQGEFVGMRDAIGLLQAATAGLSSEEKQLALETIFGQDAIRAAALLAEQGVPAYDAMGQAMANAGSAAEQAEERNQGFNFAVETLKGSIETLQIIIGSTFLPVLADMINNHITPAINGFMEFAKKLTEAEDPLRMLGYLTRDTIPWIRDLVRAYYDDDPFGYLAERIDTVLPGFQDFALSARDIAQRAMEMAAGLLEVAGGLQDDLTPAFQTVQAVVMTGLIVLEAVFNSVFEVIKGAIDDFTKDMRTGTFTWTDVLETFKAIWLLLQPVITTVLSILGAAILGFLGAFVGLFSGVMNAAETFMATIQLVVMGVSLTLEGLADLTGGIWDLIVGIFTLNGEAVYDAIVRMATGVIDLFIGLGTTLFAIVFGTLGTVYKFIEGFVLGIIEFFARLYHDLVGGSIVVDLVTDILGWFGKLLEDGKQLFTDLVDGIKAIFDLDWAAIGQGIVNGIRDGITGAVAGLVSAAQGAAQSAYTAVTDYLGMESPSKLFAEVGVGTMEGLAIGLDEGAALPIQALEGAVARLAADLPQMLASPVSELATAAPINNTTNVTNVYQGNRYDLNVRTPESVGTVGNTVRSLQQLSNVSRG